MPFRIEYVGTPFADGGTGVDGVVVFDGVSAVPHCTLSAGVYKLTGDINATDATINAGVEVQGCNWELKCTGHFEQQAGALFHNDGEDGIDGGDAVGGIGGHVGFGGAAVSNSTNPSSAGSLLSSPPGHSSEGGRGATWGGGTLATDSVAPTDGHLGGGEDGGYGGLVHSGSIGGNRTPGFGVYQGGGGGGAGERDVFGTAGLGGGGAGSGGDPGPVKISAATMKIAGIIRANGGLPANGGDGCNATASKGGGGAPGGASIGGRTASVVLSCGSMPVITGLVESIGYDTVMGVPGAPGLGASGDDGETLTGGGGSPHDAGYTILLAAVAPSPVSEFIGL